jgi:hypothetical protein
MKKIIFLALIVSIFTGCKSTPTSLGEAMGECPTKVEVVNSYGDTIRLRYSVSETNAADQIAAEWCKEKGKLYDKNTMNCSGCCTSTYLCKSEVK